MDLLELNDEPSHLADSADQFCARKHDTVHAEASGLDRTDCGFESASFAVVEVRIRECCCHAVAS